VYNTKKYPNTAYSMSGTETSASALAHSSSSNNNNNNSVQLPQRSPKGKGKHAVEIGGEINPVPTTTPETQIGRPLFMSVRKSEGVCYRCHNTIVSNPDIIQLINGDDLTVKVRFTAEENFRVKIDAVSTKREVKALEERILALGNADENHLIAGADPLAAPSDKASEYAWLVDQRTRLQTALNSGRESVTLTTYKQVERDVVVSGRIYPNEARRLAPIFVRCGCKSHQLLTGSKMEEYLADKREVNPSWYSSLQDVPAVKKTYAEMVKTPASIMPSLPGEMKGIGLKPTANPIAHKAQVHAGVPSRSPILSILGATFLMMLAAIFKDGVKDIKKENAKHVRTAFRNFDCSDFGEDLGCEMSECGQTYLQRFVDWLTRPGHFVTLRSADEITYRNKDKMRLEKLVKLDEVNWFTKTILFVPDAQAFIRGVVDKTITSSNCENYIPVGNNVLGTLLGISLVEHIDVTFATDPAIEQMAAGLKMRQDGKWLPVTQKSAIQNCVRELTRLWSKHGMIEQALRFVPLNMQLLNFVSRQPTISLLIQKENDLGKCSGLDKIAAKNFSVFPNLKKPIKTYLKSGEKTITWNEKIKLLEKKLTKEQLSTLNNKVSTSAVGDSKLSRNRKGAKGKNPIENQPTPATGPTDEFLQFLAGVPRGTCAYYFNGHKCLRRGCDKLHEGSQSTNPKPKPARKPRADLGMGSVPPPQQPSLPQAPPKRDEHVATTNQKLDELVGLLKDVIARTAAVPQGPPQYAPPTYGGFPYGPQRVY